MAGSAAHAYTSKIGLLGTMLVMTLGLAGKAYGKPYYTDECRTSTFWPGRTNHPEMCTFGWETDPCGNTFCAKGPREMCGGKSNRYGVCGEGLMCGNCDRCVGCSTKTYDCYQDDNCIIY